ncbi:MAG: hypothetical protein LC687_04190 [Actinobacteria bacterium]|nr:hypothetical protein [Actinomycetota bacterium]MCA1807035.1 hypothetical protein [Actinomycetota bacterium]
MSDPAVEYGRQVWSADLSGSIDSVGRYLGEFPDTSPPTMALEGQEYLDQVSQTFFKRNKTAWVEMSGSYIGTYTIDTIPPSAGVGKEVYLSDLGEFRKWNGTAWVTVGVEGTAGGMQVIVQSSFPATPDLNMVVFRSDLGKYFIWDGESDNGWLDMASIPIYLGEFDSAFPTSQPGLPLLAGQECFRTDIGEFFKYSGNYWIEL